MEAAGVDMHLSALSFDHVQQAYSLLACEFLYLFITREAERMMARNRDSLLGQCVWEAFPDLLGTKVEHACRRAASEGVSSEFDHYCPALDIWYHLQLDPMDGGIIVGGRDISREKLLEEHLTQSKDILSLVSE